LDLDLFSAYSIVLPAMTGIGTYRKQIKPLKKLSGLIFIALILDLSGTIFANYGLNNMWMFHSYTSMETVFLSLIFIDLLTKWKKSMVRFLLRGFCLFSVMNIIQLESLDEFNSNQRLIAGITIIFYVMTYFFQIFQEAKINRLERNAYFILASALLIYFTGTFFLFIFGKDAPTAVTLRLWDVHSILNIFLNIGYSLTLWKGVKKLT
jgi:hypothetical protein